jgi:eukaryotic-like serine/threonine-protein kinase
MALVFLGTDLKHGREVAVKVLRPELSAVVGAERFLREIQVTSHLQHPHILPLYDSGSAGELLYYVMPYVHGESLRSRLERERQLPVDEALLITRTIAGALDYAHRQGILHRDIKPENILLQDGQPLLTDFGIALAVTAAGGDRMTYTGITIGTPNYMSPEQAAGERQLDARSDVFALGCVAYETLVGEPPFVGPTTQSIVAAVLTDDPEPIAQRRRTVSEGVAAVIHRALERLPADRFASAAEFAAALSAPPVAASRRPRPRPRVRTIVTLGVGAVVLFGAALALVLSRPATSSALPRRWDIVLPDRIPVALAGPTSSSGWQTAIALSPDGNHLAYVAPSGNTTVLAVRALDSDSSVTLPGTDGAYHPSYSPDGRWIAFFAGNLLRKVPANGGNPVTLVAVDRITGATWATPERLLVFENEGFDLHWISTGAATGDSVVHLRTQFGTPDILPGGTWAAGQLSSGQLALLSLKDGTELAVTGRGVLPLDSVRQADLLFGTSPHWLSSGYLVYGAGDGVLTALPFDGKSRRVMGAPVPLFSGVRLEAGFGYGEFAISRDGTLIYVPGRNQLYVNIALVTPGAGAHLDTLPFPRGAYTQPRISPDGTELAAQVRNPIGGWQVVLMNLRTGVRQQVTVAGNYRTFPASWLPSGRELMIGLWDPVQFLNYGARIQSLETGEARDVHLQGASYMTVSPDGRSFVYSDFRTGDLHLRSLGSDTTTTPIPGQGFAASFSPNGRWLAWGGLNGAVEVSPLPPTGAVYSVAERGQQPQWAPDGRSLIFRDGFRFSRVAVTTTGGFHADRPRLLIAGPFLSTYAWNYAIDRSGRLLVLLNSPEREARTLAVISGFTRRVEQAAQSQVP